MAVYEVDEFSFEVPDGYVDRSMNLFTPPAGLMQATRQSLLVTREPRTEETVSQQASRLVKELAAKVPGMKVLGQRDRALGALPGREARIHAVQGTVPVYQRCFFVGHYGTLLTVIATSMRSQSAQCDALVERFISSLRLKKR
ncbi:DcrB-related protein [Polyangium jinanense]|uniref:DcrB-related protein n=1 Tax=Polyangium jinanense TaxID=2829994 RepID=A0A9X3XFN2_9BACT|nr:DcrB-related protein [Polyangium jinanense]MDC3956783.1 DcrB-related protein [Polyangium jinanense]MDC3987221.1 DcrB-related protein [Polyangium jinanense]